MRTSRLLPILLAAAAILLLPACSRVKDDWKAAQSTDTSEAYQDFLQQHPDSEFAVQAQARLKQLAEDRDWQQAASTDTLEAYEQFVAQHADSKWAQEARVRIENFNLAAGSQATAVVPAEGAVAVPVAPGVIATTPAPSAAAAPAAAPKSARPPASRPAAPRPDATRRAAAATAPGSHYVQLGAFSTRARAEADWRTLQSKHAAELKNLKPRYATGTSQGKPVVRLQVGLGSEARAAALCTSLKKRGQACVAVH
ncbi:MAG: SPOR domain-containing protein [Gammaproteobacteria bacterium]|nr:SPOR domain-containing protein [Gammaproteobacteria bacterium]